MAEIQLDLHLTYKHINKHYRLQVKVQIVPSSKTKNVKKKKKTATNKQT